MSSQQKECECHSRQIHHRLSVTNKCQSTLQGQGDLKNTSDDTSDDVRTEA